jgi:hypothetical protein
MNLTSILKESLSLIRQQPKVFIPKLVTTLLYSVYTLWAAKLSLKAVSVKTPEAMAALFPEVLMLFAFMLGIYFIDLVSYAMYPSIVNDFNSKRDIMLRKSLLEALKAWKIIVVLGFAIQLFLLAMLAVAGFIEVMALESSTPVLTSVIIPLFIVCMIAFSILVFFVIPIAIAEKKGIRQSFQKSIELGLRHKKDLLKINLVFLALAAVTLAVSLLSEFTGLIALAALIVFLAVRLIQAVIYTYLCVVNPIAYFKIRENT